MAVTRPGYPQLRGRPPARSQQGQYFQESQWREQPQWERDYSQYPGQRREEQGDVGPGEGSKKKERAGLGGIFNLSNAILSRKETNILHLGLKCGLKRPINKFDVFIDIHKYIRKVNMKKYFLNKNSQPVSAMASVPVDSGLRNKSLFNPVNGANQQIEVFTGLVIRDLEHLVPKKNVNPQR